MHAFLLVEFARGELGASFRTTGSENPVVESGVALETTFPLFPGEGQSLVAVGGVELAEFDQPLAEALGLFKWVGLSIALGFRAK